MWGDVSDWRATVEEMEGALGGSPRYRFVSPNVCVSGSAGCKDMGDGLHEVRDQNC